MNLSELKIFPPSVRKRVKEKLNFLSVNGVIVKNRYTSHKRLEELVEYMENPDNDYMEIEEMSLYYFIKTIIRCEELDDYNILNGKLYNIVIDFYI